MTFPNWSMASMHPCMRRILTMVLLRSWSSWILRIWRRKSSTVVFWKSTKFGPESRALNLPKAFFMTLLGVAAPVTEVGPGVGLPPWCDTLPAAGLPPSTAEPVALSFRDCRFATAASNGELPGVAAAGVEFGVGTRLIAGCGERENVDCVLPRIVDCCESVVEERLLCDSGGVLMTASLMAPVYVHAWPGDAIAAEAPRSRMLRQWKFSQPFRVVLPPTFSSDVRAGLEDLDLGAEQG
jgi:hypothetical protein